MYGFATEQICAIRGGSSRVKPDASRPKDSKHVWIQPFSTERQVSAVFSQS